MVEGYLNCFAAMGFDGTENTREYSLGEYIDKISQS